MNGNDELRSTSSGIGLFGQADPRQYLRYLATVSSGVEKVGSERIGDRDTTRYHAVIQFDHALWTSCPTRASRSSASTSRRSADSSTRCVKLSVAIFPSTSGSTGPGLLRRLRMEMTVDGEHMSIEMNLDEYGVAVAVEAPPADQVTSMRSLIGGTSDGSGSERVRIRTWGRLTSAAWSR